MLVGTSRPLAKAAGIPAEDAAFFETHIRPTLVTECIECHGAEKQKGGLRLDSRGGWQKGGDSGAAIIPKDPEGSLLLRSIKHLEPDLKMPEKAPKLDAAVLENFTRWIAMGAPDPRDAPPKTTGSKPSWPELLAARRSWWSLKPLHDTAVPSNFANDANAAGLAVHPVDQFLNAAMTKAGLTPEPAASAETLVRRLHFLLVGLPPSPEEVHTFSTAYSADQKKAVRERTNQLLASPSFGEHWARHWMDLVRYAESHGSEGDPEIPNAFQYRDYLIRAFNADVPLDQLIREHIAGDLLQTPRISATGVNESRIGPAHLRMAEHGYQPVDSLDDQIKAVDNQIDVVTKAFQGMTVSCARCHDHKFDAISQRDYTALYGIFSSVRPAQLPIDSDERLQVSKKETLTGLKATIRNALSDLWLSQLETLPQTLAQRVHPPVEKAVSDLESRLVEVNKTLSELQWSRINSGSMKHSAAPYALWTFSNGPQDAMGRLSSELVGGASIESGALVLNGKSAFLKTAPLPVEVTEKTFEAWLTTSNLEQRAGGIVGIEQITSHAFDSVVFAEKQRRKWLAGSNNFKRTEQTEGDEEASGKDELIHIALSYSADGTIAVFNNGKPYGKPFRKDVLHVYPAGDNRILLGLRHSNAGNGFFEGKIHEARLYTRALSAEDIAISFSAGMLPKRAQSTTVGLSADAEKKLQALNNEAEEIRAEITRRKPASTDERLEKLTASPEHPLHLAYKAATLAERNFISFAEDYRKKMLSKIKDAKSFNATTFTDFWDLGEEGQARWILNGPDAGIVPRGDFRVEKDGDQIFKTLFPKGIGASLLVPQWGGVAMSPDFKIGTKKISVRFAAANGAMLRLIPDNYPLGISGIFPRAIVQRSASAWSVLDSEYRINSNAFLELTTLGHQTRRADPPKGAPGFVEGESFFVLEKVAFHDGKEAPKEEHPGLELVLAECRQSTADGVISALSRCLSDAVRAWRSGTLREAQRSLLDSAVQCGILSNKTATHKTLEQAVARYRELTKALPSPAFAPGVHEHQGKDAAFLARGDHKKPGDPVPRGFLEVLDSRPITDLQSGRLELSERLISKNNPLTARVMANRIWLWMFGAGIVPTPDNFGRMGEKPTHPELLDFLAMRLIKEGWSLKSLVSYLADTDAFQRTSAGTALAGTKDPSNELLSHAHVRRLEAESIRDALLSVSGSLDQTHFGPSVAPTVPRRSIYLQQRRNFLPALLTTFDAPKPFTTIGKRDSTTVPAQSLTLLNDPAIIQLARRWGQNIRNQGQDADQEVRLMFEGAFGRIPSAAETQKALEFVKSRGGPDELQALAHALFNVKEFIYLR